MKYIVPYHIYFFKLGKMSQILSSDAAEGLMWYCEQEFP